MTTYRQDLAVKTVGGRPDFHKVTEFAREAVAASGVQNGICVVATHHTTCSVMTQEESFDTTYNGLEYLQQDLWDVLEKFIPTTRVEGQYFHPGPKLTEFSARHGEEKPETLNTDGHLRSMMVGRSVTLVIADGVLDTGTFGHVYFIDFDQTRPRTRQLTVQIMGD